MSRAAAAIVAVVVLLGLAVALRLAAPDADSGTDGAGWAAGLPEGVEPARVVRHVDGDTLRLVGREGSQLLPDDDETAVRLLEIDTPETGRSGGREECFADEATRALEELAPVGADVWVERDRDLHDPYDRMLLYLWTDEGEMVNLELVREGYAVAVLFEPNDRYIEQMRDAEQEARRHERGLWAACR